DHSRQGDEHVEYVYVRRLVRRRSCFGRVDWPLDATSAAMNIYRYLTFRRWLVIAFAVLPLAAAAHVGSPNVFFEGQADPYPVRVIIRPPAVLPGIAQVDVRVGGAGTFEVFLQASFVEAGHATAPAPTRASKVPGENNLFNAPIWLLRNGSYSIAVILEGPQGRGKVFVPLNSAAIRPPAMSPALATTLVVLALSIFVGAV